MISGTYLEFFGWLGFHHLWLGCGLAGCCWLFTWVVKRQAPLSRYYFWGGTLLTLSLLPLIAWIPRKIDVPAPPETVNDVSDQPISAQLDRVEATDLATLPAANEPVGMLTTLTAKLPSRAALLSGLFSLWILGLAFGLVNLALAFVHLLRLKRSVQPVEPALRQWFSQTTETLSLKRSIELGYSQLAEVPMAVGLFKPCILLPARIGRDLAEHEKRPIILHELAHLMRGDDWVNLAQRFIQAMFFYHPGIRLAAREFELAREMACDAWAIEYSGKKKAYAASMLRLLETSHSKRRFALSMSAVGGKSQLMRRMEHMLDTVPRGSSREKWLRPILLVLFPMSLLAFAQVAPPPPQPVPEQPVLESFLPKVPVPIIVEQRTAPTVAPNPATPNLPDLSAPRAIHSGPDQIQPVQPPRPDVEIAAPDGVLPQPAPLQPQKRLAPSKPVMPTAPNPEPGEIIQLVTPEFSQWLPTLQEEDQVLIREMDRKVQRATRVPPVPARRERVSAAALRRKAHFEMSGEGAIPQRSRSISIKELKRQLREGTVIADGRERPMTEQEKADIQETLQVLHEKLQHQRAQFKQQVVEQEAQRREYMERLSEEKMRMKEELQRNAVQLQRQQAEWEKVEALYQERRQKQEEIMGGVKQRWEQQRRDLKQAEAQLYEQRKRAIELERAEREKMRREVNEKMRREIEEHRVFSERSRNSWQSREALEQQKQELERKLAEISRQLEEIEDK